MSMYCFGHNLASVQKVLTQVDEVWEWYITAMSMYCFGHNLASVQKVLTQVNEEWEWYIIAID